MTQTQPEARQLRRTYQDEVSILGMATVLLRRRRLVLSLAIVGGLVGLARGVLSTRVYRSQATFIPQRSEPSTTGLAAAVGQLGIRLPTGGGGGWGPSMYVEMLRSRALLEPVALDSVTIVEEGGRRVSTIEALAVTGPTPELRTARATKALKDRVRVREVDALGGVELAVVTPWPSVSLQVATRLLDELNRFNLQTRKSQAAAERQFVERQVADAEQALLSAEERLREFLERNRVITVPELVVRRDRLQREVTLRQELYTSLLQAREEARIREVRDTPVITILEEPRLPVVGEPRGTPQKTVLGVLAGAIIGVFIAFVSQGLVSARNAENPDAEQFMRLMEEATPRFLRRSTR